MFQEYSLSEHNLHYNKPTPQGRFLQLLLDRLGPVPDMWYCDTMDMPYMHHLKQYFSGTLIMYCWWDPARDSFTRHLNEMDLQVILITPDVAYAGIHPKQTVIGWQKQYGLHLDLMKLTRPSKYTTGKNFLCMMRNHKSERLQFLQHLWNNNLLDNLISYLGQAPTDYNGRTERTVPDILKPRRFIDSEYTHSLDSDFETWCVENLPLLLPDDSSSSNESNTDFYTVGNISWYDRTAYSVVLETYWAKTQFLTEKSFKPILAQHPFVNLGNGTTRLLASLGFDVFEDIVDMGLDDLATHEKIQAFKPLHFDIDPKRLANNLMCFGDLRNDAVQEQSLLVDRLEDSLTNLRV